MDNKRKCFPFLLWFLGFQWALHLQAQTVDTTFSFYFNTATYTTDAKAQKDFETFLKTIQSVTTIRGYTDTVGTTAFNKMLAQRRTQQVYQLLPSTLKGNAEIVAEGETAAFETLRQNRRVDVIGIKKNVTATTTSVEKDSIQDSVQELNVEHILFLPDVPILTEASYAYVKALAQQLQQYPTHKFQIIGHVNYPSRLPAERLKDLYQLSEARAKVVYNLLVEYGIGATRMTYKGVGNSQPIYAEPINDEQKRANMRVQVLILRQ